SPKSRTQTTIETEALLRCNPQSQRDVTPPDPPLQRGGAGGHPPSSIAPLWVVSIPAKKVRARNIYLPKSNTGSLVPVPTSLKLKPPLSDILTRPAMGGSFEFGLSTRTLSSVSYLPSMVFGLPFCVTFQTNVSSLLRFSSIATELPRAAFHAPTTLPLSIGG